MINWINQTIWINREIINWINKTGWTNKTIWKYIERIIWTNKTRWINNTIINWINKTGWTNKTRWINKTNIINVKNIIEKIKWVNKTRWFNRTRWINNTRYINESIYINKTRWIKNNKSLVIIKKELERIKDKNENSTGLYLNFNNIYVLGGVSFSGLIILAGTFYIAWKCWLKEKIEEMVIIYFIGEEGKSCLEYIICLKGYFDYLKYIKEKRHDNEEYYGLTPEQIAICKEAKAISKIKYETALKVRWDELAKNATRPNDLYHRELFKRALKPEIEKTTEMTELHKKNNEEKSNIIKMEEGNNILYEYEIKPGTPRRRRKNVAI